VPEVAKTLDVSEQTYHRWRAQYGGMQRLKELERENAQLKQLVADKELENLALREISRQRPRWGYRRAHATLRGEGWAVSRKRVQPLWREEGLRVPVRRRKRWRLGNSTMPAAWLAAERPDQVWAIDFQFDQTADGRILKLRRDARTARHKRHSPQLIECN
jgi:transposase InsO family protein